MTGPITVDSDSMVLGMGTNTNDFVPRIGKMSSGNKNAFFGFNVAASDTAGHNSRLAGIDTPVFDHDAANKAYVDSKAGGTFSQLAQISATTNSATLSFSCTPGKLYMIMVYCMAGTTVFRMDMPVVYQTNNDISEVKIAQANLQGIQTYAIVTVKSTSITLNIVSSYNVPTCGIYVYG